GLGLEPELRVDVAIPPVTMLTAEQTVLAEELITLWPVLLVIAGIVLLMALLVASHGNRWIVWLISGLLTAITGVALKLGDRKSTRLNSSHVSISYAVFCLKKKIQN